MLNSKTRLCVIGVFAVAAAVLLGNGLAYSLQDGGGDPPILEELKRSLDVSRLELVELGSFSALSPEILFEVPLDGAERQVMLRQRSMRSDDFLLMVTDAQGVLIETEAPAPRTYRGSVVDSGDSKVAASVTVDGGIEAYLTLGTDSDWVVQPMPAAFAGLLAGDHVVFRTSDSIAGEWNCGVDDILPDQDLRHPADGGTYDGAFLYECEIACDADREYYQRNGSDVGATIADIEQVLAAVEIIYERDVEIVYDITTILVRTSEPDPYSTSDPGSLLNQFRNHWRNNHGSIRRDVAHLFTGKNMDGSVIGIAWLGEICGSRGYGVSQSQYTPNMNLRTSLTAHELGHNWNSSHCSGSDCRIMCPSNGGCTGDVTRFGQSSRNQIISHRNSRGCLDQIQLPDPIDPPFHETWTSTTIDPLSWSDVDGAVVDSLAQNEPSAPFSLNLGQNDKIDSNRADLDITSRPAFLSYWIQGTNLEGGESLFVEYYSRDFAWAPLEIIPASALTSQWFRFDSTLLDGDERHDRFQLRLRTDADDSNDSFHVDNVSLAFVDVEVDIAPAQQIVTAGERYFFDASVTNFTGQSQSVQAWVSIFSPDGSPLFATNPKFGPKSVTLAPFNTKSKSNLSFRVPAGTPPAYFYRVIAFVGTSLDEIMYAEEKNFRVVE